MGDQKTSALVQNHLKGFIGISPIGHISDVPTKAKRIYSLLSYYLPYRNYISMNYPYLSSRSSNLFKRFVKNVCSYLSFICEGILAIPGLSSENNRVELIPRLLEILPGGASFRSYEHFRQLSLIDGEVPVLRRFDFGTAENIRRYNQPVPPDYDYSLVQVPLYFHSGEGDILVSKKSLERLSDYIQSLGKLAFTRFHKNWDHFSIIASPDPSEFHDSILKDLDAIEAA